MAIAENSSEPVEGEAEGVEGEVEMGGEEEDRLSLLPERIRETLSSLLLDKSVNALVVWLCDSVCVCVCSEGVVQPAILDQVVQMIRDKVSP